MECAIFTAYFKKYSLKRKKRYSVYIKPISVIANLVIINSALFFGLGKTIHNLDFIIYCNASWLIISYYLNFYNVNRYHKNIEVFSRFLIQLVLFTFVYFAFFGFTNQTIHTWQHLKILAVIFSGVGIFRSLYLWALRKYRVEGKNLRNIIIVGTNKSVKKLTNFFQEHPELGYRITGFFSDKINADPKYLGNITDSFDYLKMHEVDEIYCSLSELTEKQIAEFIHYADNNLVVLKLLPDTKDVYTTKMVVEYYDYIPILSLRTIPIDSFVNQVVKRIFDILFSVFILVFVLSWLTPLLFIFIKLESKGPLFFKQTRDGLNGNRFVCYKYRSMYINQKANDTPCTKNDYRVTKIGKFLRKTSIDELPQFFNVFLSDMSVVGPRPHMLSETKKYAKAVDKYMVRHFVKPGITGLAQVKGYRGEIEKNEEMEFRVKLDIFYIENWSFLLDLKIIGQTITNIIKGEKKAY
jgi:putative colanic acid biosynthesis UDP-glucose lipid carrier transferase